MDELPRATGRPRDDFPESVRRLLRDRTGGRCSHPACGTSTTGPSQSRAGGVASIGVAAHITAAAANGPRYNAALTPEQRASYANGIWACSTHAQLIDSDTTRYSAHLLQEWKKDAEDRALAAMEGTNEAERFFFRHRIIVRESTFRNAIPCFIDDVAVDRAIGAVKSTLVLRVLMELALNAFRHAGASEALLSSDSHAVSLSHRGAGFGWNELRNYAEPGGGAMSVEDLESMANGEIALVFREIDGESIWSVVDAVGLAASGESSLPCTLAAREMFDIQKRELHARFNGCPSVHVFVHRSVMVSDIRWYAASEARRYFADRVIVFHGLDETDPLRRRLRDWFPHATFGTPQ